MSRGYFAERAAAVTVRIDTMTKSPAALMLPAPVRQAVRDLASLVHELAVEVEKCKAGIP